jgi:predicted TIM-barrel fold metal-dependent hydrolase
MDKYEDYVQVISLVYPPVELIGDPAKSVQLAKLANDEMAELVVKYPDRFVAAVACLPMDDMDEALREADRAIKDLKLRGVQIYTPTMRKPLDSPEFTPLYEKMSQHNLPIWLHPGRGIEYPDYGNETRSMYDVWHCLAWPYDTSVTMTRFVYSGILEKYPNLKIITHHCGGMIPYYAERILGFYGQDERRLGEEYKIELTKPILDYFRMFYNDTALYGNTSGLMCAYAFFGADHILFGTDMPHDNRLGDGLIRNTIGAIDQMDIGDVEKRRIYQDNAIRLLRLLI